MKNDLNRYPVILSLIKSIIIIIISNIISNRMSQKRGIHRVINTVVTRSESKKETKVSLAINLTHEGIGSRTAIIIIAQIQIITIKIKIITHTITIIIIIKITPSGMMTAERRIVFRIKEVATRMATRIIIAIITRGIHKIQHRATTRMNLCKEVRTGTTIIISDLIRNR